MITQEQELKIKKFLGTALGVSNIEGELHEFDTVMNFIKYLEADEEHFLETDIAVIAENNVVYYKGDFYEFSEISYQLDKEKQTIVDNSQTETIETLKTELATLKTTLDLTSYATNDAVNRKFESLGTVLRYMGSKPSAREIFNVTDAKPGDVYNDASSDHNYVKTESGWDNLSAGTTTEATLDMGEPQDILNFYEWYNTPNFVIDQSHSAETNEVTFHATEADGSVISGVTLTMLDALSNEIGQPKPMGPTGILVINKDEIDPTVKKLKFTKTNRKDVIVDYEFI